MVLHGPANMPHNCDALRGARLVERLNVSVLLCNAFASLQCLPFAWALRTALRLTHPKCPHTLLNYRLCMLILYP